MTMSTDLYLAILAMDAYNRGYDAGLVVGGSQIGNALLGFDSSIMTVNGQRSDLPQSFFAQSYTLNGQRVISYRGTDAATDVVSGWTLAGGDYLSPQARRAD